MLVGLIFAWAQGALYACCALFVLALCGVHVPSLDIAVAVILCAAFGRGADFICQAMISERRVVRDAIASIDIDVAVRRVTGQE